MAINWRGVFPAVCTQFHNDFSLNIPATLTHIDAMLDAGIHGLVMMGSVGENTTLEPGEKRELLKATVAHVRKRVPVLTGVAEYTTARGVPLGRRGREARAPTGSWCCRRWSTSPTTGRRSPTSALSRGRAGCRSWFTTTRRPTRSTSRRRCSRVGRRAEVRVHQGVERQPAPHHRHHQPDERPLRALRRRGRPVAGVLLLGAVGWVSGLVNAFPDGEPADLGPGDPPASGTEALDVYRWYTPLLHLDTHVKLVQYIKLASAECGFGTRAVPRAAPAAGREREQMLRSPIIREAIPVTRLATEKLSSSRRLDAITVNPHLTSSTRTPAASRRASSSPAGRTSAAGRWPSVRSVSRASSIASARAW